MLEVKAIPHFIRLHDFNERQVEDVLDLATRIKRGVSRAELEGRTVGLLFFRGSLRTRTSLEVALSQLGGHTVNLTASSDFRELEARSGTVALAQRGGTYSKSGGHNPLHPGPPPARASVPRPDGGGGRGGLRACGGGGGNPRGCVCGHARARDGRAGRRPR